MNLYSEIENSLKTKNSWFYSSLLLLVIFSLLIYAQTVGYGLIAYDDSIYLRKNSHLLNGFTTSNLI